MINLEIYTDGSSLGNPGPGGWGVVVVSSEKIVKELSGGEKNTTNNKMELTGAIEALKYLSEANFDKCQIFSDSAYVLGGITSWIINWQRNGWKTANKKAVLNQEFWQELTSLNNKLSDKISWHKVKGHSGHIYNEKADELAQNFANKQKIN